MSKRTKRKLTREEKAQIKAVMQQTRVNGKQPHSAQQTIPYDRIWPDGICLVDGKLYTKTVQFQDVNYQLAQNEDKTAIFDGWCDFLNYFDSSIRFQFSFLNLAASEDSFEESILIPSRPDAFNDVRTEYAEMLRNQLAKGNNTCKNMRRNLWFRFRDRQVSWEQLPLPTPYAAAESITVTQEVMRLPRKEQEVVLLYYYQGMKAKEIAQALGVSGAAVSKRLKQARNRLYIALEGGAKNE